MENLSFDKMYNCFAEHRLAPLFFKYIDILKSRNLNKDAQHLLEIAYSPLTQENIEVISKIVIELETLVTNDYNEFIDLDVQANTLN